VVDRGARPRGVQKDVRQHAGGMKNGKQVGKAAPRQRPVSYREAGSALPPSARGAVHEVKVRRHPQDATQRMSAQGTVPLKTPREVQAELLHQTPLMRRLNESASWLSDVFGVSDDEPEPAKFAGAPPEMVDGRKLNLAEMLNESATWLDCDISESDAEENNAHAEQNIITTKQVIRSFSY